VKFAMLPADRIDPPKENEFKHDYRSIEALAENIRRVGLLHPIVVMAKDGGRYEVVAGERRYRALTEFLGWKEIPCQVLGKLSPVDAAERRVSENYYRDTYDWATEAIACWHLYQDGRSVEELATLWGFSGEEAKEIRRLLIVGRFLTALEARGEELPPLARLPGGLKAAVAAISAFHSRRPAEEGRLATELPEEAVPVLAELFRRALEENWPPEQLALEARRRALELSEGALEEELQRAREALGEELQAELQKREQEYRQELARLKAAYQEQQQKLQAALQGEKGESAKLIAELQDALRQREALMRELQQRWQKQVDAVVKERLAEEVRRREEELKKKAEEEARARAQRELQRLKALEKQLSERQAQLEMRERALAENVARYSRRILSQAAGLREAMAAAMSAAILEELSQEERHELMNQLGKTQLEMVNFLSYLKEVGNDGKD